MPLYDDENLPIINKSKHSKRGNTKNKMEGPMFKKTKKKSHQRSHKGNIKYSNLLLSRKTYQIKEREDFLQRTPSLEEPSPTAITHLQIKIAYTQCNVIDTLCL
jgi:hypothetical protein